MGLKTVHCWVLTMALLAAGGALAAKKPKAAQDPDAPTAARRAPGKRRRGFMSIRRIGTAAPMPCRTSQRWRGRCSR